MLYYAGLLRHLKAAQKAGSNARYLLRRGRRYFAYLDTAAYLWTRIAARQAIPVLEYRDKLVGNTVLVGPYKLHLPNCCHH